MITIRELAEATEECPVCLGDAQKAIFPCPAPPGCGGTGAVPRIPGLRGPCRCEGYRDACWSCREQDRLSSDGMWRHSRECAAKNCISGYIVKQGYEALGVLLEDARRRRWAVTFMPDGSVEIENEEGKTMGVGGGIDEAYAKALEREETS